MTPKDPPIPHFSLKTNGFLIVSIFHFLALLVPLVVLWGSLWASLDHLWAQLGPLRGVLGASGLPPLLLLVAPRCTSLLKEGSRELKTGKWKLFKKNMRF